MLGNALQDIIFSTNIVLYSAEELADSKSELYRDILEHRDQYSIFIAAVTSMNYKVFDEVSKKVYIRESTVWNQLGSTF